MGNVLCRLAKYEDIVANFFPCPVKEKFYADCHGSCLQEPFHTSSLIILHNFFFTVWFLALISNFGSWRHEPLDLFSLKI